MRDDDKRGLKLSATQLEVPENGERTFTVRLNTEPSGDVTVEVTGVAGTDLTVTGPAPGNIDLGAGGVLTFTDTSWDVAQTVTVAAGPDADAADDVETLTLQASDADYDGTPERALTVTVTDTDTPRLEVVADTPVTVDENGATPGTFTVTLASEPTAPVTVSVSGLEGTDLKGLAVVAHLHRGELGPARRTFEVTAGDDADAQDDAATLTLKAEGAAEYEALDASTVAVAVRDDDKRGLKLSKTQLQMPEGGEGRFTVRLNTQPAGDVTVRVTGMSGTDLTVTGPDNADLGADGVLTFTDITWNRAQTVTVAAAEDADAANDVETLTLTASGADYDGTAAATVAVTVGDDGTAELVLSENARDGLTVQEGGNPSQSFTVRLASVPTGTVTVRIAGEPGTGGAPAAQPAGARLLGRELGRAADGRGAGRGRRECDERQDGAAADPGRGAGICRAQAGPGRGDRRGRRVGGDPALPGEAFGRRGRTVALRREPHHAAGGRRPGPGDGDGGHGPDGEDRQWQGPRLRWSARLHVRELEQAPVGGSRGG